MKAMRQRRGGQEGAPGERRSRGKGKGQRGGSQSGGGSRVCNNLPAP